RAHPADVVHFQCLAVPEVDRLLLRTDRPLVLTAHDLLPRRTARRTPGWRSLFARFARLVVHFSRWRDSLCARFARVRVHWSRGRAVLCAFGVPEAKLRVIPHPVFRSDAPRADDGRTVLALGVIRAYKGLPD